MKALKNSVINCPPATTNKQKLAPTLKIGALLRKTLQFRYKIFPLLSARARARARDDAPPAQGAGRRLPPFERKCGNSFALAGRGAILLDFITPFLRGQESASKDVYSVRLLFGAPNRVYPRRALVVVEDRRGWAVVTFEEVYAHARSAVGVVVLCCCLLKV